MIGQNLRSILGQQSCAVMLTDLAGTTNRLSMLQVLRATLFVHIKVEVR